MGSFKKNKHHRTLLGFTLVELIVVITILAILATIAFLSFGGYSANARDSARLSDMTNLSKGLSLYQTKAGNLPLPERKIDITAGATTIGYQGYADSQTLSNISASDMKDPLDSERYTYATNKNLTKYQILGFLEGNDTLTFSPTEQTYATTPTTYTNRYPISKGDTVGILTDAVTKIPVQAIAGTTTINTSTTSTGYAVYFDTKDTIPTATGSTLFSTIYNRRSDLITDKTIASQDASLVGYWDMETMSGGKLYDYSMYSQTGTIIGTLDSQKGIKGNGLYFNDQYSYVDIPKTSALKNFTTFTANVFIKSTLDKSDWVGWVDIINTYNGANCDYGAFCIRWAGGLLYNHAFGTSTGLNNSISQTYINNNTWHLITEKYDGANLYTYIDGRVIAKSAYSSDIRVINQNLKFGGLLVKTTLDEIRIYNRALSDSEITTLYNTTK